MNLVDLPEPIRRRAWLGYPLALAISLLAIWVRLQFPAPLAGFPLLLPTAAVIVATFTCGLGPGLLATILTWSIAKYLFIPPLGSLYLPWPQGWIGLGFYVGLAATILTLMEAMLRANRAQKRDKLALRQLNQTLEARVAERTAELQTEMAERSEAEEQVRQLQKMQSIGQLTGGIAHDFNNLLTVIRGSVDLLRRPDLSDLKRERYVQAIGETADRAAKLTGQLLAFARRQPLTPTLFDAAESVGEIAAMVQTLLGSRITLDLQLPQDSYSILADRSQFDTAIVNMAINARDAMNGEGRLIIATGPVSGIPALRSHEPRSGDYVAVTVIDTGSGIDPADVDRIFEPFFTTKGVGEGTGLGLSQVIGFAKQSNGDIRVESTVGQGTTFTLYLPRSQAELEEAPAPDDEVGIAGDGVCVLVVEDNPQVGEFATQALRELGYDSVHAMDAASALAELGRDCARFHVVFSDVVMPGMSGLELGEEVRRRYPDVPIILTSGYSHVLAQNGQHGFELLHKPYSVDQLSRVLRKAITWRARREHGLRSGVPAA